jgi:hypothetical protein
VTLVLRRNNPDHHDPAQRERMWNAYHQDLYVGSINETMGASDQPAYWRWNVIIHCGAHDTGIRAQMAIDGRAETREVAMAAFRKSFDRYLIYIGDEGWAEHVEHMRLLKARSGPKRY